MCGLCHQRCAGFAKIVKSDEEKEEDDDEDKDNDKDNDKDVQALPKL